MTITLNHTIVHARDKEAAARFFAQIFGLPFEGSGGHFAPVRVNDTLTLDFADEPGAVNRRAKGTPYRRPIGTPRSALLKGRYRAR